MVRAPPLLGALVCAHCMPFVVWVLLVVVAGDFLDIRFWTFHSVADSDTFLWHAGNRPWIYAAERSARDFDLGVLVMPVA